MKYLFILSFLIFSSVSFGQKYFNDADQIVSVLNQRQVIHYLKLPVNIDTLHLIDREKLFKKFNEIKIYWNDCLTYVDFSDSIIQKLTNHNPNTLYRKECNVYILSYRVDESKYFKMTIDKPCVNEQVEVVFKIRRNKKLKLQSIKSYAL